MGCAVRETNAETSERYYNAAREALERGDPNHDAERLFRDSLEYAERIQGDSCKRDLTIAVSLIGMAQTRAVARDFFNAQVHCTDGRKLFERCAPDNPNLPAIRELCAKYEDSFQRGLSKSGYPQPIR
jgi:hypothetical protein